MGTNTHVPGLSTAVACSHRTGNFPVPWAESVNAAAGGGSREAAAGTLGHPTFVPGTQRVDSYSAV